MATRTQIIHIALARIRAGKLEQTPWYLKEEAWEIMLQISGISSDIFRAFNRPVIATVIDTISGLTQKQVLTRTDATVWLRAKLQDISLDIQSVHKEEDPILYARLDAQLELILELLNEDKVTDG